MRWNTPIARQLVVACNSVKNVMHVVDGCITSLFMVDIITSARIATHIPILKGRIVEE